MIFKIKKHSRSFVIIDKRPIENPFLSLQAKGLLAYFLCKPNDWVVVQGELPKHFRNGRYGIASAFKELKEAGHATLEMIRDEQGKLRGKEWHIHEQPVRGVEAR